MFVHCLSRTLSLSHSHSYTLTCSRVLPYSRTLALHTLHTLSCLVCLPDHGCMCVVCVVRCGVRACVVALSLFDRPLCCPSVFRFISLSFSLPSLSFSLSPNGSMGRRVLGPKTTRSGTWMCALVLVCSSCTRVPSDQSPPMGTSATVSCHCSKPATTAVGKVSLLFFFFFFLEGSKRRRGGPSSNNNSPQSINMPGTRFGGKNIHL